MNIQFVPGTSYERLYLVNLRDIYEPIADDLKTVEDLLRSSLSESTNPPIAAMNNFLLESAGKRIRPALVILSERATSVGGKCTCGHRKLIEIAAAVELIHMASLIHDDVLDQATIRHTRPSINAQYGDDISIALGDYIYSKALQLIANCGNPSVFMCISEAICVMCEGELTHVCQRGNLDLSKNKYIAIAKEKSASLFAACCHAGAILGNHSQPVQTALKEFGLNFGVAFQIIDDCKDVLGEESELGKCPGQDIIAGDITLPLLILSEVVGQAERVEIRNMLGGGSNKDNLERLRTMLVNSNALSKIHEVVRSYLITAKKHLDSLGNSTYKESLKQLVDYTAR
jgi:geranylgeranyl pyrophosphate synthase